MSTPTSNTANTLRLNRQGVLALVMLTAFPYAAMAAAGRVEFAIGNVTTSSADGREKPLSKNMEINTGDTIQTLEGRAQLRFVDGGYISLQPNTQFKVEEYNYSGKADGSEIGFFKLLKGGLRAISGAIGKSNKQAYRLNTPVATIGIRGTEYLTLLVGPKLLVKVGDGAVYISNAAGDLILYKGQTGEVGSLNKKPQHSSEEMKVSAAGPNGGTPDDTQKDQQSQNEEQSVFKLGDIQDNSGLGACVVTENCSIFNLDTYAQLNALLQGPISNFAQLGALNAGAVYTGTSSISIGFAPDSATVSNVLTVDFANYSSQFTAITSTFTGTGGLNGRTITGALTGSVNSSGIFTFASGNTVISNGTNSPLSGTFSVSSGSLNSANLSKATINYTLSDSGGSYTGNSTVNLNGTAFSNSPK